MTLIWNLRSPLHVCLVHKQCVNHCIERSYGPFVLLLEVIPLHSLAAAVRSEREGPPKWGRTDGRTADGRDVPSKYRVEQKSSC